MATSRKKQEEKQKQQAFENVSRGMEKAKEEIHTEEVLCDADLVVVDVCNTLKPFMKFSMRHSWKTKRKAYLASAIICLGASVFYIYMGSWGYTAMFLTLAVVFPALLALFHYLVVWAQLRKDDEFLNTTYRYYFREHSFVGVSTYQKAKIKYQEDYINLDECVDADDYFYLYLNQRVAFVIEKNNFVKGDRETLERLLSKIKGYKKEEK